MGSAPVEVMEGFIHGDIYVVTDTTDPFEVFVYPIVILGEEKPSVPAILAMVEVSNDGEYKKIIDSLLRFEGDLFRVSEAPFHRMDGSISCGIVFVAIENAIMDHRVHKPDPQYIYKLGTG